jgi:hypothetical protein
VLTPTPKLTTILFLRGAALARSLRSHASHEQRAIRTLRPANHFDSHKPYGKAWLPWLAKYGPTPLQMITSEKGETGGIISVYRTYLR